MKTLKNKHSIDISAFPEGKPHRTEHERKVIKNLPDYAFTVSL